MGIRRVLFPIGVGTAMSTGLFALVATIGKAQMGCAYLLSGIPLATLLFVVFPDAALDWLDPGGEGGANIALPVVALSAWFQFAALFSIASAIFIRRLSAVRP